LRGLDLNQRPLGYEGKSSDHGSQDEPSQTNDDKALPNHLVGPFWFISVGLLHSRFIGLDGGADFDRASLQDGIRTRVSVAITLCSGSTVVTRR
jgi:hypothetical protein